LAGGGANFSRGFFSWDEQYLPALYRDRTVVQRSSAQTLPAGYLPLGALPESMPLQRGLVMVHAPVFPLAPHTIDVLLVHLGDRSL